MTGERIDDPASRGAGGAAPASAAESHQPSPPPQALAVSPPPVVARAAVQAPGVEPGTVVAEKYRVEKVLNAGGMGIILVAHHLQLDQRVAIKVLRAAALEDPEIVARFAREARVAAKIRSEHAVRVLDVGSLSSGAPYMVMEYLEGSDLAAVLKARGPLPAEEAVEYVLQVSEALAEAHLAGVVHRDLKPANLFLTRRADGSSLVKVLDFGISKLLEPREGEESALTRTSMVMGSPHYMSPEQLRSARSVDGRSDVWALGVVLFRLVSGKLPFQGDTTPELCGEILHGEPTPLVDLVPDAPSVLGAVISRCLRKKAGERYATVAELAAALDPIASGRAKLSVERICAVYRDAPPRAFPADRAPPSQGSEVLGEGSADQGITQTDPMPPFSEEAPAHASVAPPTASAQGRGSAWFGASMAAAALAAVVVASVVVTRGRSVPSRPEAAPVVSAAVAKHVDADAAPSVDVARSPVEAPALAASSARQVATTRPRAATTARTPSSPPPSASSPPPAPPTPAPTASDPQSRFGGPF